MLGALRKLLPHLLQKAIAQILLLLGTLHWASWAAFLKPELFRTVFRPLAMSLSADIPVASSGEIIWRLGSLLSSEGRDEALEMWSQLSLMWSSMDVIDFHSADHHLLCVTKLPSYFSCDSAWLWRTSWCPSSSLVCHQPAHHCLSTPLLGELLTSFCDFVCQKSIVRDENGY